MKVFEKLVFSLLISIVPTLTANANEFDIYGGEPPNPIPPYAVIVADNQHTFDHGGSIIEQSFGVNRFTPSARRSALNNMFSLSVMEQIIAKEKLNGAKLIVHVGDGLNNGCSAEWTGFSHSMQKSGLPWFLAPGNHDAFYLGISNPFVSARSSNTLLDSADGWGRLCRPFRATNGYREHFNINQEPRFIFTKRELINSYLDVLKNRAPLDPGKKILDPNKAVQKETGLTCHTDPNVRYLHRVCWYQSDTKTDWASRKPWGDFIVQELRWTYPASGKVVSTLLVDSSDYPHRQEIARSCAGRFLAGKRCNRFGGIKASLSNMQRNIISEWLAENSSDGIKTVIVAHHPIRKSQNGNHSWQVSGDVKNWSKNVARDKQASAIVTAHTHDGYVARKARNLLVEFNVGSLVDSPIHYMRLNWGLGNGGNELFPRFSSIYLSKPKQGDRGYYDKEYNKTCKNLVLEELKIPSSRLNTPFKSSIKIKRIGDREGMESQLSSFLTEALVYSRVLSEKGSTTTTVPVCYRVDKYGCEKGTLGDTCAATEDVNRCSVEDIESQRFTNMKALQTTQDAVKLANSIVGELEAVQRGKISKNKAIRIRRMIARKLEAIKIFDELNPPAEPKRYGSIKSCLSLLASQAR